MQAPAPCGVAAALACGALLLYSPSSLAADVSFTDVSHAAGVDRSTESYGATVADVNGDGYPDIWVSNHRTRPSLYINQGDGTFHDAAMGVAIWRDHPAKDTHGGSFADIDNDGDLDQLVTVGRGNPQQLLINENGVLADQTGRYGIGSAWVGGRLPVWYDYNGDRLVDVSVAQYAGVSRMYTSHGMSFSDDTSILRSACARHHYAHLMDVNGDGRLDFVCSGEATFPTAVFDMTTVPWTRITSQFPTVANVADSVVGDFNNDGRMDMFLLSGVQGRPSGFAQHGSNQIEFRAAGGNKGIVFTSDGPISVELSWSLTQRENFLDYIFVGADGHHPSGLPIALDPADSSIHGLPPAPPAERTPAVLIGYDAARRRWHIKTATNHRWSNAYFTVTTQAPIYALRGTGIWATDMPARPTLLIATGNGWQDATEAAGLTEPISCGSATTGDYNNDGYLDIYLACRGGAENLPNILYYGGPGGVFRKAPTTEGFAGPVGAAIVSGAGTADSAVSGDFDLDGFLDLFVTNGFNMRPEFVGGPGLLLHNQGNGNHWIMLDLVGTVSQRDAVGARVTVTANGVEQTRVQNGGYHRWSQEDARIHFGMAAADQTDVTIEWPSGLVDRYTGVAVDHLYRATEAEGLDMENPTAGGSGSASCGMPTYDPSSQAAVYVWQECDSNRWSMRATGGGGFAVWTGHFSTDVPYTSVSPYSLESTDTLDTSDPANFAFTMKVSGQWEDGVDFTVPDSSGKCFTVDSTSSIAVYLGKTKTRVPATFNPKTLTSC